MDKLLESIPAIAYHCYFSDDKYHIDQISKHSEKLLGIAGGILKDDPNKLFDYFTENDLILFNLRMQKGQNWNLELKLNNKTFKNVAIKNNAGWQCLLIDITAQKKAQEQINDYQEQLRRMIYTLAHVEEEEKHKLAINLHDNIGQTLIMAKMLFQRVCTKTSTPSDDNNKQQKQEIYDLIEMALSQTKNLLSELYPAILYEMGPIPAIDALAEKLLQNYSVNIIFEHQEIYDLDNELKIFLYRSIKEILIELIEQNESRISLQLKKRWKEVSVIFQYDGKKLSIETTKNKFGISSLIEKIIALDGEIVLEEKNIEIRIPKE